MVLVTLFSGLTAVFAQETSPYGEPADTPPIKVTSDSPFPLLLDGLLAEEPVSTVKPGAQVCVQNTIAYVSQRERWVFEKWSHGSSQQCVTLTEPGVYRAMFDHEFVLHIQSDISGMKVSSWVIDGERVEVEVPEIIEEGDRTRFRFQGWGEGESPFTAKNVLAPLVPMDLEPTWVREYFVELVGSDGVDVEGSGWYAEASILPIRAPDTVALDIEGARLKFDSWQSVGAYFVEIEEPQQANRTVEVAGSYDLKATYKKQFW